MSSASRAKRSKIASFLSLVEALDDQLRFAAMIPERLGLQLARALDMQPEFRTRLRDRLRKAQPESADTELALLTRALAAGSRPQSRSEAEPVGKAAATPVAQGEESAPPAAAGPSDRQEILPGLWLEGGAEAGTPRLVLSGTRIDAGLQARLITWLQSQD